MTLGVPWRVKGIHPDARETAREAARRSGRSLGEWLNTVILESAEEEGVQPRSRAYDDDADDDNLFGVHERLDELTRQLERLDRGTAAARRGGGTGSESLAAAIERLDRRLEQLIAGGGIAAGHDARRAGPAGDPWALGMDQAVAEITARQQALDSNVVPRMSDSDSGPPRPPAAPGQRPMPAQNLSGLEDQLRHITTQIEALRQPNVLEKEIVELRGTLGEIARTLMEAVPRRAIEALEAEVRALAGRLDNSRDTGVDAGTLAAVERGLAEIRDALHSLTPAENLDGFREAVVNLAQKIDTLASSVPDPAAFQQLESAISALRGIVSHVASNEALAQLTGEVRSLGAKIDQMAASGGSNALDVLEKRIAHIADALEARAQSGGSVPPQLDALIKGLSDKIERLQLSGGDQVALTNFEDRIVKLVEKLDASGARFSQLEAIERGLADLLVHMEAQRAGGAAPAAVSNVNGLQRDLARTQTSLEAVHGTLGHVVDRLAMLEGDMRGQAPAEPKMPPAVQLPKAPAASAPPPPQPQPQPAPPDRAAAASQAAAAMARANPKTPRPPIEPNLPPDHPLEPGSRAGRGRVAGSAADRIAASEAALGQTRPPVIPDPGGKSNFIAAARRAAQAAADPSPADLRAAAAHGDTAEESTRKTLAERVRSLFVGAGVVLLIGGALRIAVNLNEPGNVLSGAPQLAEIQAEPPSDDIGTTASIEAPQVAAGAASRPDVARGEDIPRDTAALLQIPAPPSVITPPTMPARPEKSPPSGGDTLPPSVGGPALRAAAAAGNPAAAFEVGVRYAEGRGVAANITEAARWFERAAKEGLALAQFRLAGLYENGIGVKKDIETARRYYRAAADQGNAKAMHNLAVLYAEGAAVRPDYRSAAQWFRSAADHGISDSQYNLAVLYARGIGVDRNLSESYKWFALAAAQGDQDAARKRDEVGKRLDMQTLAAARQALRAFVPKPQPAAATTAESPPGGWDAAPASSSDATPMPRPKARATTGPIRLGSR